MTEAKKPTKTKTGTKPIGNMPAEIPEQEKDTFEHPDNELFEKAKAAGKKIDPKAFSAAHKSAAVDAKIVNEETSSDDQSEGDVEDQQDGHEEPWSAGGQSSEHTAKAEQSGQSNEKVYEEVEVLDPLPTKESGLSVRMKAGAVAAVAIAALVGGGLFVRGHKAVDAAPAAQVVADAAPAGVNPGGATGQGMSTAEFGQSSAERAVMDAEAAVTAAVDIEPSSDMAPLPESERNCGSSYLTTRDKAICERNTAAVYFKCAVDGRRVDITLPGCDKVF